MKKQLTDHLYTNVGKKITVTQDVVKEVLNEASKGTWMVIVKDVKGKPHVVICEENFIIKSTIRDIEE